MVRSEALQRLYAAADREFDWPLRAADRAFAQAGWGGQAEAIYGEALDRPRVHPLIGVLWIECRAARGACGASSSAPRSALRTSALVFRPRRCWRSAGEGSPSTRAPPASSRARQTEAGGSQAAPPAAVLIEATVLVE